MGKPLTRVATSLVLAAALATRLGAQAAEDPRAVQPERPSVATHAGTVAPGYLEIEAGIEHDRFSPALSSSLAPVVFKFGATSHVQIGAFTSVMHNPSGTSIGDVAVGAKVRVLDDAPILGDFALLPAVKFPTGATDKGAGTGTTDGSLLLISSHDFGAVALDVNAGVTRRGGDGTVAPKTATVWAASFGGSFTERVGWVWEFYGYPGTSGPGGSAPITAILAGPTFHVRNSLALDIGGIFPMSGPQPHALYVGGVQNVGRIW